MSCKAACQETLSELKLRFCCVTVSVVMLLEIKVYTEHVNNLFILEVVVVCKPL